MPESAFIGRQNYLNQLEELLSESPDENSKYILYLLGKGGIGKTKILQKLIEICDKKEIPHSGIIDFYGIEMSSRITAIANRIALKLRSYDKSGLFDKYWKLRKEFETGKISEQDVVNEFLSSLCMWIDTVIADGKRPVLIFDTLEAIKYSIVEKDLVNDWLPQLKKALIILSGRDQEQEKIDFPEELAYSVIYSQVDTFTEEEAIEYLQEREVWDIIKEDKVCDKIFEFTQKKPLLLALSADRIRGSACSSSISPIDLVKNTTVSGFEKKLVEELQRSDVIQNPEGTILPYMAHIIRPFDKELIEFLMPELSTPIKIGDKEVQSEIVLKNLGELSFVKEKIDEETGVRTYWLQDEVRYLFHKYLFSVYPETWNNICYDLSEKLIEFYNNKLEEAKEKGDSLEEQKCIARRFYHEIYLDPKAYSKLRERFQKARESYQYGFASLLIGTVRFLADYLPEPEYYSFGLAEGRWLMDMGDTKRAEERFKELLKDNEYNNPHRVPYILNALGCINFNLGRFDKSLEYHKKSLELSLHVDKHLYTVEENYIGMLYQRMGQWNDAIIHFKRAYISARTDEPDTNLIATYLSNIGHTYGLIGQYDMGIQYCENALEKQTSTLNAAKIKILLADIYRRKGDYDRALKDIKEAMSHFEEIDYQNLTDSYYFLGLAQWYKGDLENNKVFLIEAQKSFEKSIEISKKYKFIREVYRPLHEVSQIYWELGDKEKARDANDEAYILSLKAHDIYYSINSLVKKAEYDYEDGNYETIPQYAEILKCEFENKKYEFPLFYGRMRRIQGAIAFQQEKYYNAADYYAEGLYLIAKHGGYRKYTKDFELKYLKSQLESLPNKIALKFYITLEEFWEKKSILKDETVQDLVRWADEHIDFLFSNLTL